MERDSLLYRIRRAGQVVAHKIMPDELLSKLYFKIVLRKSLNLNDPRTFNEKVQWMKLNYYPQNELVVTCTDKYSVRNYIKKQGYEKYLVPLLGVWDDARDIDWDMLPDKFVLKCNHGCAYNVVVTNKESVDKKKIEHQLNQWLKEDFGVYNIELHYSKIERHRVICEEFLGSNITDYKFFCFHGEPKFMYVSNNLIHDREAQIGFFELDGSKIPLKRDDYADISEVRLPEFFEEMLDVAKNLSTDFLFVRVDFFLSNHRFYFAEFTFTPGAGMMPFNPDKYDLEYGSMLDISTLKEKYGVKKEQ